MRPLLLALSAGFRVAVAARAAAYRRGWLARRRLRHPVVSVGNLTVGGTGKTPFVAYLAALLARRGLKPAILSRGYGRRADHRTVAIDPGPDRQPDPRAVGDEPAMLACKLPGVPIVVARDRYLAGQLAEERFGVDVHILDDGFQHLGLERDVDIVLLDASDPVAGSALLPAGRMREPWPALARAHLIVITRTELAEGREHEARARQVNPAAGVYRARTRLTALRDVRTGQAHPPRDFLSTPLYAYCGIGNPAAFFSDLRMWGFSAIKQELGFPDHYVVDAAQLERFEGARDGAAMLTTEKDAMNLAVTNGRLPHTLACVVEPELEGAGAFEEALFARLESVEVNA